jgi:PRTRC genetic system ThiF family protein
VAQTHALSLKLDNRPLRVLVVGAGGSGSSIFLALPYLHQAMLAWGHCGLYVYLMDADTVSATNCIRQPFSVSDIGQDKAIALVNRVNLFWNLNWNAIPEFFSASTDVGEMDLVIGCVDSRASRKMIHDVVTKRDAKVGYYLDLGNSASHGQYVLGQPDNNTNTKTRNRLPTAAELHPEIIDTSIAEDDLPSCSAVDALQRQEPFINQALAMQCLAMLTQLLRYGKTSYHGGFFNARTGTVQPISVPKPIRVK